MLWRTASSLQRGLGWGEAFETWFGGSWDLFACSGSAHIPEFGLQVPFGDAEKINCASMHKPYTREYMPHTLFLGKNHGSVITQGTAMGNSCRSGSCHLLGCPSTPSRPLQPHTSMPQTILVPAVHSLPHRAATCPLCSAFPSAPFRCWAPHAPAICWSGRRRSTQKVLPRRFMQTTEVRIK